MEHYLSVMEIQITPKSSTGVERAVEVTVSATEIAAAEEKTTRRYASSIRLPGFRPGKAPVAVVKKRFAEAIRNETIETVVREAYKEVVAKDDVKIASQPHIHGLNFQEGQPLTFELHFEVRPTVELARTSGFRVERNAQNVTDTHVQEQIDHMREERATWTPTDDKPLEGDMARATLAVADDSGTISEGREVTLVLGDGRAIPGIEELIMEAAPGQTNERPVRWPDDFPDEQQRGQTKMVRVTLSEVKRKTLPEFDDAFAREVGDFDSADALRTAVREDIQKHLDREADAAIRQRLIDEIISANPFDIPKSWVQELIRNYAKVYEINEEQFAKLEEEFRGVAERQIRRDLIVDTLAEREQLAATERDLDDRIAEQATARKISPSDLYMTLEKAGRLKEMERSLTEEKVFHWLMANNEIV
jgi:trigger factor